MANAPPGYDSSLESPRSKVKREKREKYEAEVAKVRRQQEEKKDRAEEIRREEAAAEELKERLQAAKQATEIARLAARNAQDKAKAAKARWDLIEEQWLATQDAYTTQAWKSGYHNNSSFLRGIIGVPTASAQNADDNPPLLLVPGKRSLSIHKPDPHCDGRSYPSIRGGFWTNGGFPLDKTFGMSDKNIEEPYQHTASRREVDMIQNRIEYKPGTIFSTIWHQDYARDQFWLEEDKQYLTLNREMGVIFSKRRKFVIVARFRDHFISLPVMTSAADNLRSNTSEYVQILNQGQDQSRVKKLTAYEFLFQRKPSSNAPWSAMPWTGKGLAWMAHPVCHQVDIKCEIIGSLLPYSLQYLLRIWPVLMQQKTLDHLTQGEGITAKKGDYGKFDGNKAAADLHATLSRLDLSPVVNSSPSWSEVTSRQRKKAAHQLARREAGAKNFDVLACAIRAVEGMIPELLDIEGVDGTGVETMASLQRAGILLQRLATNLVPETPVTAEGGGSVNPTPFPRPAVEQQLHGLNLYTMDGSSEQHTFAQHVQMGHSPPAKRRRGEEPSRVSRSQTKQRNNNSV